MESSSISYRTLGRWRFVFSLFSLFSVVFLVFACCGGFYATREFGRANLISFFALALMSLLPLSAGLYLLCLAFRTVQFAQDGNKISQTVSAFGWVRTKTLTADRIVFVRQWYGHRQPRVWLTLYSVSGRKKRLLANQQVCDDVGRLYTWLKMNSPFKCVDVTKRRPIG